MKKIVSVLLCLVMMMSLCTAAFAAGTDTTDYCDCDPSVYNPFPEDNNDGETHHFICTVCGKRVPMKDAAHTWDCDELGKHVEEGGTQCLCGAKKPHYVIVNFDVNGGTPIGETRVLVNETATSGSTITFKTATTTKVGYTLAGWTKGTTEYAVGEEVTLKVKANTVKITLTAKWDECDHMGNHWTYKPVDDTHHSVTCAECGFVDSQSTVCVFETGECACGNKCPHATLTYKDNGDGTHSGSCKECKKVIETSTNVKHKFVDGKCVCGAVEPVEKFTVTYKAGDTGVTSMPVDENKYVANTIVTIKGLVGTSTVPEGYTFAGWTTDGNDFYEVGETVRITGNLVLTPVLVKQTADCDHMGNHWAYERVDDTHHKVICDDCKAVVTESTACVFKGDLGPCACVCGNTCKHTSYIYKVSEDGKTHEGYCADCGKHIATEDGEHELTYVNNKNGKNGTHSATCDKCGALVVDHEKHVFKGNKCTLCGARKSAPSGGSTTGTTTATTKSPKTGDMGVVLYAATALLSLSGTAVVIKKRKNDK